MGLSRESLPPHLRELVEQVEAIQAVRKNEAVSLTLPYPPSTNTYWRHPNKGPCAGRSLISRAGRAYRKAVYGAVLGRISGAMAGRLSVDIRVFPPDRRRRDLDNTLKALADALQHAGVYLDDSQIDRLTVSRWPVTPPGKVVVTISAMQAKGEAA